MRTAFAYGTNIDHRLQRLYRRRAEVAHSLGMENFIRVSNELAGREPDVWAAERVEKLELEAAALDEMFTETMMGAA